MTLTTPSTIAPSRVAARVRELADTLTRSDDVLARRRADAARAFERDGLPTSRLEAWKKTDVRHLDRDDWNLAAPDLDAWTEERLDAVPLATALDADRIVVVDGRVHRGLSHCEFPDGAYAGSFAGARSVMPDLLEDHLGASATTDEGRPELALIAANDALSQDVAVVVVPNDTTLERPVHIVHVARCDTGGSPTVHPRVLVVLGKSSEASIIETYVAAEGASEYWINPVTEMIVGENARLAHTRVQLDADDATHTAHVRIRQDRASEVRSLHVALGSRVSRIDASAELAGEGAHCDLDGLYVLEGDRHVDHHTTLDHAVSRCTSRELFKGILSGTARGVFNGRIIVRQDAQKTDSVQSNPNLLLSDDALVHTRPQLEIYADDVKCTHGATIGRLRDDAMFYLRSRGIPKTAARDLLIRAFAGEVLERIRPQALADDLVGRVAARIPAVNPR